MKFDTLLRHVDVMNLIPTLSHPLSDFIDSVIKGESPATVILFEKDFNVSLHSDICTIFFQTWDVIGTSKLNILV